MTALQVELYLQERPYVLIHPFFEGDEVVVLGGGLRVAASSVLARVWVRRGVGGYMRHGHLRNVGVAHEKACRDICSRTPLFETIFDIGCESLIGDELVDLKSTGALLGDSLGNDRGISRPPAALLDF